jgi:hypothetical protein
VACQSEPRSPVTTRALPASPDCTPPAGGDAKESMLRDRMQTPPCSVLSMDADDELEASLERSREEAGRIKDATARREEARTAYHLKEDTTAKELVAIFRRTLQLLVDQGEREEIQLWARPRIGRNSGLIYGWRIPDPIYTDYGSRHRALLDTGDIATISPSVKRRDACGLTSIEAWVGEQVMRARSEFHPDRPYQEARSDYYDLA